MLSYDNNVIKINNAVQLINIIIILTFSIKIEQIHMKIFGIIQQTMPYVQLINFIDFVECFCCWFIRGPNG